MIRRNAVKPQGGIGLRALKRVLAIGAHPDDIELGCLGYLMKLAKDAHIRAYVASLGSIGDPTTGPHRRKESQKALAVLNCEELRFRGKAGIEMSDFDEIHEELYDMIQSFQPDLILCLGPHDSHQEHRYIYELMMTGARRLHSSIMTYGIVSNTLDFQPRIFVDISDQYLEKKKALQFFTSQKDRYYMQDDFLDIFHTHKYPILHGLTFCESFQCERIFL